MSSGLEVLGGPETSECHGRTVVARPVDLYTPPTPFPRPRPTSPSPSLFTDPDVTLFVHQDEPTSSVEQRTSQPLHYEFVYPVEPRNPWYTSSGLKHDLCAPPMNTMTHTVRKMTSRPRLVVVHSPLLRESTVHIEISHSYSTNSQYDIPTGGHLTRLYRYVFH